MFPTQVLENQFGEISNNAMKGGSGQISCEFTVDNTNAAGLKNFKSLFGVKAAYMHTSTTPVAGSPNPAAGYLLLQLSNPNSALLSLQAAIGSPVSGTPINVTTGVTGGLAYVIQTLGTTTLTQWQALGLPVGVVPAVGVSFVAPATVTGSGTGTIEVPAAAGSGVAGLDIIGDPSLSAQPSDGSGSWILCRFLAPQSSSVTTVQGTAPAAGTVVKLRISMIAALGAQE